MCAIGLWSVTNYSGMAEETKNTGSEELIDLEGIVRDIDLTPTDSVAAPPKAQEPLHAEALSEDQIEDLLMTESPELASEMAAIREVATSGDQDEIKPLEQEDAALGQALKGQSRTSIRERVRFQMLKLLGLAKSAKSLGKRAATDMKGVLREIVIRTKVSVVSLLANRRAELAVVFNWLNSRTTGQKVSMILSVLALLGLVFIAGNTIRGTLLPKNEKPWVANFADHADGVFTYGPEGPFEDFNDPLLHPEFVILIERIVVNLARSENARDGDNPMAAFELYLQTDNQEAAIEIKDRMVEIKDSLSRAVERMTYLDLVGEEGKAKLKLLIRRDLNGVLTKGKVRRVFFKTIVLNPE